MEDGSENIQINNILESIATNHEVIEISDEIESLCTNFSTCDEQDKAELANTITSLAFGLFDLKVTLLDSHKPEQNLRNQMISLFFSELSKTSNPYTNFLSEPTKEQ